MNNKADASRSSLRTPASLLLAGQTCYIAVTQVHPGGDANDHHHIFAHYAESELWATVHLGQFIGMAILLVGLVALSFSFDAQGTTARWLARLGAAAAAATLALYGALQAVDGVALKHAVTAWATAPDIEKAARFASAESLRWLEWGMRSYLGYAMGLTFFLFAFALGFTAHVPRTIYWLMGGSGLAYVAQGWIAGTDGFTAAQSFAIVLGWGMSLLWMVFLVIVAWRRQSSRPLPASETLSRTAHT